MSDVSRVLLLLVLASCGGTIAEKHGRPASDSGIEAPIGPGCFASDAACPNDPGFVCQEQAGYCCCETP